jgi:hypothetical protein
MAHDHDHDHPPVLPPRDPPPEPISSPKPDRLRPEHPRPAEPVDPLEHPGRSAPSRAGQSPDK